MRFIITREMELARTRLEAYKNTIQPYPALPKGETPIVPHQDIGYRQLNNEVEQIKGKMVWLANKLNEHLDRKDEDIF